jgi:hypothetical protein
LLYRSSPTAELNDEHDECDDQQNMDVCSKNVKSDEAEQP